jgi:MFS family permease
MTAGPLEASQAPTLRGVAAYASLLRLPETARLLSGALIGRMQIGMASLAILLVVHGSTGSFADAGLAAGVYGAVGAAFTPVLGRLIDRVGQVVVLAACGIVCPIAFVALAFGARHDVSFGELLGIAAVAGAALPPLASCMRALWPTLAPEQHQKEAAYMLDAISQELIWTLGPLLVAVFVAVWSASIALLVCAVLTAIGTAIFASSPVTRSWRPEARHPSWLGPLTSRRILILLVCVAIASLALGICQVAIPAIAVRAGSSASAGVLLGVWSIGSMLGAIAFGTIHWRAPMERRYGALSLAMAAVMVPLIVCGSIPAGILGAFVCGLPLAAWISCQYTLVSDAAPRGTLTEAFAWNAAAGFGALALGAAAGGWLINTYGLHWSFAVAAVIGTVAAVVAATSVHAEL